MTERMTVVQGAWRVPGHLLIWAAIPHLVAYPLYAAGVHNAYLALAAPFVWVGFTMTTFVSEVCSVLDDKQTTSKGAIDFAAKIAGITLGLTTWQWWWY